MLPEEVHKRNPPIVIDELCGYAAVLDVQTQKYVVVHIPRIVLAIRTYLICSLAFLIQLHVKSCDYGTKALYRN